MTEVKRLLITPGEPAGIGPDITLQLAQEDNPAELVVIADPDLLNSRAQQLGLHIKLIECDLASTPVSHQAKTLKIIPEKLIIPAKPGELNSENAPYVIRTLERAATFALHRKASAIVTGPVNKGILNQAGISFSGHTEFFANYCHVPQTVMLFVIDKLKVALATTHLPLANVPKAITASHLRSIITILHQGLKKTFHHSSPRILVCGLNPHAGENGYLGREEIEIISPALDELRQQGMQLEGPLPADTIFTPPFIERADAILAMYHDQALPLVKYAGFGHAVNVTLGLPFIRTSVDHGTAVDIAGSGKSDPGSLIAAVKLAREISIS